MDGNFSLATEIFFCQLYIIRVPLGTSAITAVYALLPHKCSSVVRALADGTMGHRIDPS